MLGRTNWLLWALLLCMIGLIGLVSNAKGLISFPGLLLLSIVLIIAPNVVFSLWPNGSSRAHRLFSLLLLLMPVLLISYIFSITQGVPVGYQDVHRHMYIYSNLFDAGGHITFEQVPAMSFNFVGLYIITRFISNIFLLDINVVAMLMPPLLNAAIVLLVYTVVAKAHSHQVGILTALLYGWESQVLIFGQEYRTQTLGTVLFFSAILVFIIGAGMSRKFKNNKLDLRTLALLLIFASGVAVASFVSSFYFILAIMAIFLITLILTRRLGMVADEAVLMKQSGVLISAFVGLLLFYLIFISRGFDTVIGAFMNMFEDVARPSNINLDNFGKPLYGDLIDLFSFALRGALLVAVLFYAYTVLKNRKAAQIILLSALGSLLAFNVIGSLLNMPLSPGRVYVLSYALLSVAAVSLLLTVGKWIKRHAPRLKPAFVFLFTIIVIVIVSTSYVKIPDYVIGEPSPIRGQERIDSTVYWDANEAQYAMAGFLANSPNSKINIQSVIYNYKLLTISRSNNIYVTNVPLLAANGDLFVLEDKFKGEPFSGRSSFDELSSTYYLSRVYSNGDYLAYRM